MCGSAFHFLHREDEFAIYLADGDGDAHIRLVEEGVCLNGRERRGKEEFRRDGVVVCRGAYLALDLALALAVDLR